MSRSERVAKYNRLMEIEDALGIQATYDGVNTFTNIKK
jgi:enolase